MTEKNKKIVILSNHHAYTYNLRKEVIQKLIDENYIVYIVLPYGEKVDLLKEMGCKFIDLPLDKRGMNPLRDASLMYNYYKIIRRIKPKAVLTYTIKPNLYGGIVCRLLAIPQIANVTGLGTAIQNESILQKILLKVYKIAFKKTYCIFFQNQENQEYFKKQGIGLNEHRILPGSGVNLYDYIYQEYTKTDDKIKFLYIGRLMKDKGIEEYLEAAQNLTKRYSNVEFRILGNFEEDKYKNIIESNTNDQIKYLGISNNVKNEIKEVDCIVQPSYHEGMSNVLLEGAAMGKPLIASNISGCKEVIDDGVNGFLFQVRSSKDLVKRLIQFVELKDETRRMMGVNSRKKVEKEFDRNIVVNEYIKAINTI